MLGKLEQLINNSNQCASRFQLLHSAVTDFGFPEKVSGLGTFNCELRIIPWFKFHQQYMHNLALLDCLIAAEESSEAAKLFFK